MTRLNEDIDKFWVPIPYICSTDQRKTKNPDTPFSIFPKKAKEAILNL